MTSRRLMSAGAPRAGRGTGRFSDTPAALTDLRRRRAEPSPGRRLDPASAEGRREHFRLGAARTVAVLFAFLASLEVFALGVSL